MNNEITNWAKVLENDYAEQQLSVGISDHTDFPEFLEEGEVEAFFTIPAEIGFDSVLVTPPTGWEILEGRGSEPARVAGVNEPDTIEWSVVMRRS